MENNNNSIEFICLGSGSTGNCYIFRKNNECVMVECGLPFKKLTTKLLEYGITFDSIRSVIITHRHSDHSESVKELVGLGIPCFVPVSLWVDKTNPLVINYADKSRVKLASWLKCYCFSTVHDVESYGFLFLDTENKETTLFMTDTKLFEFPLYDLPINYIFIECNHIRKQLEVIMQKALDNGKQAEVFKFKRQAAYHLSLAGCKKFLNNLKHIESVKSIFLIHLSKDCCNDALVKDEIRTVYGIPTFVCYKDGGIH